MKKAGIIIIGLAMTIFVTGHFFIYQAVLKTHKKEFKAYLRSNYCKKEVIEITPSELYTDNSRIKWLDENKEICLNGVMYDILQITTSGTKVLLCVVNDKSEKELMDQYRDQFNDGYPNSSTGKKGSTLIKDLCSLKYLPSEVRGGLNRTAENFIYGTSICLITGDFNASVYSPPDLI